MKPSVLIFIDTYNIGGPGKGIIQFLKHGGLEFCDPLVVGFWRGPIGKWQFKNAAEATGVRFEVLHQKHPYDPLVIRGALRLARDNKSDILQSHGYKAHVVCFVLSIIMKLPWIAFVHGWTSENIKVKFYNGLEKFIVRFADKIVFVSENLKKRLDLKKTTSEKLLTISNAIDIIDTGQQFSDQRIKYDVNIDEIIIGVIGRLSPEKGQFDFIEAMAHVVSKHNKVKAFLVGDGQDKSMLQMRVKELEISENIIFTGYQEDVAPFYSAFDLVVLPSHSEGMPNVALEAMMFAKPVVATNVGGIPEVVINDLTGKLVPAHNPQLLAEAILDLLNNKGKMKRLGNLGRKRVFEEFDPYRRAKKIIDIYEDLMRKCNAIH